MTPAARLHALAGSPRIDGCEDAPAHCVVCAAPAARTHDYDSWQGSTFTDQNKLRGHGLSTRVCEPCVWAHSWVAPPDQEPNPPGKKGLNLRLFSHLWSERDGYRSLNKGDKPAIRAWLRDRRDGEAWWCCIADTGQKHTLPWTREANSVRGPVRFEERDVVIGSWGLVDAMTAALTAGATKEEIETGRYGQRAWSIAEREVAGLEAAYASLRGGGWWALALWLSQRDEEQVAARLAAERDARAAAKAAQKGKASGRAATARGRVRRGGGGDPVDAPGVPGDERLVGGAGALESPGDAPAQGVSDERLSGAAGDRDAPGPAPGGGQLGWGW